MNNKEVVLMKILKTISIDKDLADRLKLEPNQSQLIEELLIKYFGYSNSQIIELENKIKALQQQLDELKKRKQEAEKLKEETEKSKLIVVKEQNYLNELRNQVESYFKKDKDLYNAVSWKHRAITNEKVKLEKKLRDLRELKGIERQKLINKFLEWKKKR